MNPIFLLFALAVADHFLNQNYTWNGWKDD
jgi:hypothetical protein